MEKDLDHILLEQLHSAKRSKKVIKTAKKLLGENDTLVIEGELLVDNRIKFFESMIQDKSLLKKNHKKKKTKDLDILAKNPMYDWYKTVFMVTSFGYGIMINSFKSYVSIFSIRKTDKDD